MSLRDDSHPGILVAVNCAGVVAGLLPDSLDVALGYDCCENRKELGTVCQSDVSSLW